MNKAKMLGLSMTAVFTALLLSGVTSAYAGGCQGDLDIDSATVFENPNEVSAKINVCDTITLTGAKGTGVLTNGTLVVTTTHGGVLDSAAQANAADPIQHNHYVNLTDVLSDECIGAGANFQVVSLSFESPGIAMWPGNMMYKIWEIPKVFDGTDAITMNSTTFTLGDIGVNPNVVSFNIVPTAGGVCILVEEIHGADLDDLVKVGGLPMVIDSNALLLAGIQSTAIWMIPVVAGAAGAGAYFIKTRMNKD